MLPTLIASALFHASPVEMIQRIVWTLTFAAQLVLLVVLFGRGRAPRYPWFTAAIAMNALRLMVEVLLAGRLAMVPFSATILTLGDLSVLVSLLVLVELARRAFAGLHRPLWIVNSVGLAVIATGIMAVWGPWPDWKNLAVGTLLGNLRLMQLVMQKGEFLVALLAVGLGALVVIFGRKFKAGWRSHTFLIALGLAVVSAISLAFQGVLQIAVQTHHIQTRAEFQNVEVILSSVQQIIYLAALIWWISCLWLDEPGAPEQADPAPDQEPPQAM